MLYEIDCTQWKDKTYKEKAEEMWVKVRTHAKNKMNAKLILSERAAYHYEVGDYGINDLELYLSSRRCERGYYAEFYVCSQLQGLCFMVSYDDGVDLFNFTNLE